MKHSRIFGHALVPAAFAAFVLVGCNGDTAPASGSGGNKGSGGTTANGGTVSSGGTVSAGGSVASGGTTTTGGVASSGGSGTGGASSTGGRTGTGGSTAAGGSSSTGGTTAAGGTTATGGSTSAGGTTAAGGMVGSGGTPTSGGATGMAGAGSGGSAGAPGRDGGLGGTMNRDGGTAGAPGSGGSTGTGGSAGAGGFTPPTAKNSVAYTGCSMANNIGNGNKRVGNGVMWNSDSYGTGAMVVQNWTSSTSSSWQLFDQKMTSIGGKNTVKAIVVQICIFSSRATDDEVKQMITSAKAHTNPGTHIYLVGQPVYEAGHECSLAGTGGAKWTDDEAQKIAALGIADVSYLGVFKLDSTKGEVMSDSCHATSSGEDQMAKQANAYFPAN